PADGWRSQPDLRPPLLPGQRIAREATEAHAAATHVGAVATQSGEASQQPLDGNGAFHAGEGGTEAHVHAGAKGKMPVRCAANVEAMRIDKLEGIAIGGTD